MRRLLVLCPLLVLAVACAAAPPKPPRAQEMVPANSLDEAKLHGAESPSLLDPEGAPVGAATPKTEDASAVAGKGSVTKGDCGHAMDRYLELEIASNPQLKGLPPEIVEQAKQQARAQHGEAPCTATTAQYRCAMAAKTTSAWQKCMK